MDRVTRTATPVNFTLDLNGRSGPRSGQVAHALIDAIARGQVHDGDRLPSTRTLAATFGLARTAVVAAYEELTAAGFLVARPGGSTYVERGAGEAAAVIRPVPVDDDGINAEDLRGSDRACYVTPAHQFPLGGRMPVRRRTDLLAWARAAGALVLEDDYDGEFRYDVPPLNPLRSMPAAAAHVVYLGTSSKVLARGLRVSWAVLPSRFRAAMAGYLDASGEEVSQVSAAFLASFIATGALTRHQSRAMRTYRARQERFVAACREHIPAARTLGIEAGLHVALVFDRPLDDEAAVARLADAGLICLPLSPFCVGPARRSGLLCGYSRLPETMAQGAAALIGRVTAHLMAARGA